MAKRGGDKGVTIIKREEVVAGGHHGGAWKVAYADFVTAMMAFFLLMWLLNATTDKQRRGLADYFSPTTIQARGASGTGQPLGGKSVFEDGPAVSDRGTVSVMNEHAAPVDVEDDGSDTVATKVIHAEGQAADRGGAGAEQAGALKAQATHGHLGGADQATLAAEAARRQEQAKLVDAARQMQRAIAADPALAPLARQLSIDLTPDGLRVQIHDEDGQPMFAQGSAAPNDHTRALLAKLTPILKTLKEPISLAGYTDAAAYAGAGMTNWDLSAERANATRRLLTEAGLPDARIRDVTGHADRDLLRPDTPLAAANRRVTITLLRSAGPVPNPGK
jgi:chemotaxis protein MotB